LGAAYGRLPRFHFDLTECQSRFELILAESALGCFRKNSVKILPRVRVSLPLGEYRVQPMSTGSGDVQLIRQTDGDALTVVLTMAVDPEDGKSEPQLIFNHYGNSYFLSQIWTGAGQGRELFKSKREKETARGEARTEVALLAYPSSARP
jgi:hypothetical protein